MPITILTHKGIDHIETDRVQLLRHIMKLKIATANKYIAPNAIKHTKAFIHKARVEAFTAKENYEKALEALPVYKPIKH